MALGALHSHHTIITYVCCILSISLHNNPAAAPSELIVIKIFYNPCTERERERTLDFLQRVSLCGTILSKLNEGVLFRKKEGRNL